jgi:hypothetical protein
MIEFNAKCGNCRKPISLGVRDEQARALIEEGRALCEACYGLGAGRRGTAMATMYVMNLEDRVDLARNQLDLVIMRLRAVNQARAEEVERAVESAASQLQNISELIGR